MVRHIIHTGKNDPMMSIDGACPHPEHIRPHIPKLNKPRFVLAILIVLIIWVLLVMAVDRPVFSIGLRGEETAADCR